MRGERRRQTLTGQFQPPGLLHEPRPMSEARLTRHESTLMSPEVLQVFAVLRHQSPHGRGVVEPSPSAGAHPMSQLWKRTESVLFSLAIAAAQRLTVCCW